MGLQNDRGGEVKFYPCKKGRGIGGGGGVLAMMKGGGGTKCFGVAFTRQLEVLAILEGRVCKQFPPF